MADVRWVFGLANKYGISTKGKSIQQVIEEIRAYQKSHNIKSRAGEDVKDKYKNADPTGGANVPQKKPEEKRKQTGSNAANQRQYDWHLVKLFKENGTNNARYLAILRKGSKREYGLAIDYQPRSHFWQRAIYGFNLEYKVVEYIDKYYPNNIAIKFNIADNYKS